MYRFEGIVYREHVKTLPCPGCGETPMVVRSRFRRQHPDYFVLHRRRDCVYGYDDSMRFHHPSEAIRDWNQWTVLVRDLEGLSPWM